MIRRCTFIVLLLSSSTFLQAQDDKSILSGTGEALTADDSLSIFSLIDSLMQLPIPGSQLSVRLGYNSNVQSAGRTLGIENFGLAPGLSYYHTSGAYVDVTGYWSKDFSPEYYLTVASLGYMHTFSNVFSVIGQYDRYFYALNGEDLYIPYSNTLSVTPILEFKPVSFIVNYSYYFGDAQVHRLMPGISFELAKRNWKGFKRIAILPSVYALFGNDIVTEIHYPNTLRELIRRLRQGLPAYDIVDHNRFGIMNYTFSAPISVSYKKWNFSFTYSYNIPKALPGETITYSESHYLSGSLSYLIDLTRNKSGL
jgi:hypothetical protein